MRPEQKENIIWGVNTAVIVGYSVAFVILNKIPGMVLPYIAAAVLMIVFLCAAVLTDGEKKRVFMMLYAVLSFGLVLMCGQWWCGLILLTLTSLFPCYELVLKGDRSHIFINIVLLLAGYLYSTLISSEKSDELLKTVPAYVGILIVAALLWSLLFYFLNRYQEVHKVMERAVRSSAIDAMNERQLRMKMAETKNLAEENARLEERERISRDIHNAVGHTLSAATVTLDAAQMLIDTDTERANQKIDQANERIHEAIGSVRSVVRTLDSKDDSILVCDYFNSLKEMLNNFTLDTEIKIHHNLDVIKDDGKFRIGIAAFISSAISEILTNGLKHGGATVFVILVTLNQTHIGIQVNDNGTGWGDITYEQKMKKLSDGFGLRKMESFIKENAGTFEVDGKDGFCVKISLPR